MSIRIRERIVGRWRSVTWRRNYERFARESLIGPRLLAAFAAAYPEAFFVEIGANDGHQSDPLREQMRRRRWSGVMVEPQPEPFARLARRYGANPRVALENAAVADHDGTAELYVLTSPEGDEDGEFFGSYDQLGSLSRDALASHDFIADPQSRVASVAVPCLTLESLFSKHAVERLDLMLVDTEGYDGGIVRQLAGDLPRPRLLIYEHCLMTSDERRRCREIVDDLGYEAVEEMLDTWCLDTEPGDALSAAWRELSASAYAPVHLRN